MSVKAVNKTDMQMQCWESLHSDDRGNTHENVNEIFNYFHV